MKPIAFTAIAALLGACSTTTPTAPTVASIGTAQFSTGASSSYTVTQNGVNHVLPTASSTGLLSHGGVTLRTYTTGATQGTAASFGGTGIHTFAAGLDSGTYFAGISGTPDYAVPSSSTTSLTGIYSFIVNGASKVGSLNLTADFGAGTIDDTSPGITVMGTISGSNVTGSVYIGGETAALKGGFYTNGTTPSGYLLDGVALGSNMAGVISLH